MSCLDEGWAEPEGVVERWALSNTYILNKKKQRYKTDDDNGRSKPASIFIYSHFLLKFQIPCIKIVKRNISDMHTVAKNDFSNALAILFVLLLLYRQLVDSIIIRKKSSIIWNLKHLQMMTTAI